MDSEADINAMIKKAKEITKEVKKAVDKNYDAIIVNYSNADMVGHTGDYNATVKSLEVVDKCLKKLLKVAKRNNYFVLITADHGNDPTFKGKDHTRENVPVIMYSRNFKEPKRLKQFETLANIGATIAENFQIPKPEIGESILNELK